MSLAMAKRGRQHLESLMTHIGITAEASDEEIKEMATRTFHFFDDDGSGKLSYEEFANALDSLGLVVAESEMHEMIRQMDTDGDGAIDLEEYTTMVLKTLRGFMDGDASGQQDVKEYENRYMQSLEKQRERVRARIDEHRLDTKAERRVSAEEMALRNHIRAHPRVRPDTHLRTDNNAWRDDDAMTKFSS